MRNPRYLFTLIKSFTLLAFVYSAMAVCAFSQSVTDGVTPGLLTPGAPTGSYSLSGLDNVNLYNGNLHFGLPLASVGGRGGVRVPINLFIEKHWRVEHAPNPNPLETTPIDYATYTDWLYRPYFEAGRIELRTMGHPGGDCSLPNEIWDPTAWTETLTRITFIGPDGTEYDLRDEATGGHIAANGPCHYLDSYKYRGTVFKSVDGSGITFIADSQVVDDPFGMTDLSGGYLVFRDGTRYRFDGGIVSWIRDRNGNLTTFTYGSDPNNMNTWGRLIMIKDSLNRQVTFEYNVNDSAPYGLCDRILLKGFGGASRIIRISRTSLSNVLRTTQVGDSSTPKTSLQLFPSLNGSTSSTFDPSGLVSAVWLPNGQSYNFRYNVYAELARVELPTGGAIEFDYGAGIAGDDSEGGVHAMGTGYFEIYRRVLERRVYKDAGTLEGKTTFSRPVVDQTATQNDVARTHVDSASMDSNAVLLAKTRHFFYDSALDSLNQTFSNSLLGYYPNTWKSGKEYKSEALSTDGNDTALRREEKSFEQRAHISWWPINMSSQYEPANDPRAKDSVTTIEPIGANLVASETYGYDDAVPYNNQNNVKQYDFGSGAPGGLVRETQTVYVTSSTYTGTNVFLRSLPERLSVLDSVGTERARTTFEYDNYSTDTYHAGLINRSGISGFESSFSSSYTTRGNVTATTRYLLDDNGNITGSISSYAQYDVAGNLVKLIDPRSTPTNVISTSFDFSDRFGSPDGEARANSAPVNLSSLGQSSYAFATLATNALGQTAYTQIDYYLGRPVDGEDANGIVSSGYFNDALDRPKQVIRAVNGGAVKSQTTFNYNDTGRIITTTSDQNAFNDPNPLKSEVVYDGLGRTIESRQYESGTNYIAGQTQYDALGRAFKQSNPFRPWNSESPVWTITTYDALSRVVTVTTPDSAVVKTAYSGNRVLVADQNASDVLRKKRISQTDALGRLTHLWEITTADGATEAVSFPAWPDVGTGYHTSYNYDTLDSLITVSQGSQTRTFAYDSLKRLLSAMNPESGTINYQYDNNGNLLVKTDARGVSAHYEYDALNRVFRRWYNSSNATTAMTHNSPALPAGVGASDEVKYFYDSQTLLSGAPTFSRGFATGRLVAVTYGGGSTGDYYGYDAAGRIDPKIQRTGAVNYEVDPIYNLAGGVTAQEYPSLRTVTTAYDSAGRTNSVTGSLGGGASRTYSTGIIYSSLGGMTKEQFGTTTPIYNKLFYNVRGQLAEIRESTSYTGPTDTTWNRGAIINHYSNTCWGMCSGQSMTDNNGNLKKQDVYIPNDDQISSYTMRWQQYDYDSLNRLNWVREISGETEIWRQTFAYDRYGNRSINAGGTWGQGINNTQAAVVSNTTTNRMYAPGETEANHPLVDYDQAGNQTRDYYSDPVVDYNRTYDAENRMKGSTSTDSSQTATYTYDGDGRRVKRLVNGTETWQVYGLGGELLAEYPQNGSALTPQKEYGYRNGQVLVTADAGTSGGGGSGGGGNSLSVNGSSAYTEVPNSTSLNITGPITMEAWVKLPSAATAYQPIIDKGPAFGTEGGYDLYLTDTGKLRMDIYYGSYYQGLIGSTTLSAGGWHHVAAVSDGSQLRLYVDGQLDGTAALISPMTGSTVQLRIGKNNYPYGPIYFNGLIDEVRVSNAAVYTSNFTPQTTLIAGSSTKGLWKFDGQTPNDSSGNGNNGTLNGGAAYSSEVPGGQPPNYQSISLNGSTAYLEAPNSTSLNITGSAITLEAWIKMPNPATGNYQTILEKAPAFGSEGGYVLSITDQGRARIDLYYGTYYVGLIGNTVLSANTWHHVAGVYNGSQLKIYVDGVLNNSLSTSVTITSTSMSLLIGESRYPSNHSYFNGLIDEVRISNAAVYSANFTPQMHLSADANTKGLWKFDGSTANDSSGNGNNATLYGSATYSTDVCSGNGGGGGGSSAQIHWMVTDQLGTPRMIFDQSGSLANVSRHDYLPFGEELFAGTGGRTAAQGYSANDGVRQHFTQKERDNETGLDYSINRYYSYTQGRFTSVDPDNYQARRDLSDPQSWNAYAYVNNNPLLRVDPDGKGFWDKLKNLLQGNGWISTETHLQREEQRQREWLREQERKDGTLYWRTNAQTPWTRLDINNLTRGQVYFFYCGFQKTPTPLTQEEMQSAIDQFPQDFPQFALPTAGGSEPWRSTNASRPLSKMGHAAKHLKEFQKIDPSLTEGDVAKILEHVKSVGNPSATSFGGKAFEATVNIGGKSVTVKVIESAGGVIKTGYPVP